jgi:hypothetical protein
MNQPGVFFVEWPERSRLQSVPQAKGTQSLKLT